MDKTFAGLLRNSRLASYDRTIPQVYKTTANMRKTGNWGLKRNLPTVIRTPYVNVGDLDTAEHQTPWQSGWDQVLFVQRWKENFPNSKKPVPRSQEPEHNIAVMTASQFKRFLKRVSKQSPEFQSKLKAKELNPDQVFDFLHVAFRTSPSSGVVGPTYSDHDVPWMYTVKGRYLNPVAESYAVGVAGIIVRASKRGSEDRFRGDRSLKDLYVESASIDPEGRPDVQLRAHVEKNSLKGILGEHYIQPQPSRPGTPPAPKQDDNIQANPLHESLLERISNLSNKQ
ncbi:hypothetical protein BCR43DRAFT_498116 [Syncephalastrum racemosum]|uniref:Uncharacterized protein n=1 Tax=Syncephalastrum racemosum TaxID=13706 RepID=A0A1X2H396_SYNRA|nr:hypothetical protein BCR43DRAFT_498116 [Syncephalastrum racemosum]